MLIYAIQGEIKVQNKYQVNLMKDDKVVGNLGTYSSQREARAAAAEFNIKFQRRAGKATVVPIKALRENPQRSDYTSVNGATRRDKEMYGRTRDEYPRRKTSALFLSSAIAEEEEEEEHEQEEQEDFYDDFFPPEDEIEDDYSSEPEPIEEEIEEYQPIIKNPKQISSYRVPRKPIDRPFMFGYGEQDVRVLLIDDDGYIGMVENPRYRGIQWNFISSKVEDGSVPQDKILDDISDKSGYKSELVGHIKDEYISGKKISFYLGRIIRSLHSPRNALVWVSQDEAYDLLGRNVGQHKTVFRRILDKGYNIWRKKQF